LIGSEWTTDLLLVVSVVVLPLLLLGRRRGYAVENVVGQFVPVALFLVQQLFEVRHEVLLENGALEQLEGDDVEDLGVAAHARHELTEKRGEEFAPEVLSLPEEAHENLVAVVPHGAQQVHRTVVEAIVNYVRLVADSLQIEIEEAGAAFGKELVRRSRKDASTFGLVHYVE
jgi:ribosomal protein RSM22 (predicted rRNA methylase)